ncbi:3-oxoacyl-[acyl-carrier protein] reductase [Faunimonas pinastri]|uniref:3-oxoacyl-[acyl-carrier protein] reductase n=1 Tax=Faunimonas pinastri TaxID=1855383 RepID=A0A1H9EFG3_9HYPH|nr:SDR family oxidoreductase [Faunimonas pinastri]SEQ23748.1 3-oxoacyl-[acyl-carrier protein] reductase [Faunimonas pinastri]
MTQASSKKVAVVTGGLRGIGAAIREALTQDGFVATSIDLSAEPGDALQYACDISDVAALFAVLERIEQDHGLVGVLVNNAGILSNKSLFELTPDVFDRTLAVNLRAMMFASQWVARRLTEEDEAGAIVNVASSAGRFGSSWMDYGASKGGAISLTMSLAKVLAEKKIRVNAVAPGQVVTDMHRAMSPAQQAANAARIGMKRPADPAEIAKVVAFLAGEDASFMTGSIIDVNGGRF